MSVSFFPLTQAPIEDPEEVLVVNLANSNAAHILDLLGMPDEHGHIDMYSQAPAPVFRGALILAQQLAPADEGVPAVTDPSGRFTHCGRRPGYTRDVLARLEALVDECDRLGVEMAWG